MTAANANPKLAQRGAAVVRAKQALGDAIDKKLRINGLVARSRARQLLVEQMQFEVLAKLIGCEPGEAQMRLERATLGMIEEWTRALNHVGDEIGGDK